MGRGIQYIGILGLVFFVFGLLTYFMVNYDEYYFMQLHVGLGVFLLLVFVFRGGLRPFGSAAVRRATGFSVGVTLYSALFVGLLVLVNYVALRYDPLYYDSTEQNVFTLAPQTRQVLDNLPEPVLVRVFAVGGVVKPGLEDLLNRFQRHGERFRWTIVDPERDPALAEKLGVNERDTLHFSFARPDSERAAKISRDIGEQEITNALLKLTRGGEKVVYWITGHGESDLDNPNDAGYLFLKEAIEGENLEVRKLLLATGEGVPEDAAAILLMAPRRPLLARERNAIRAYLRKGGSAVLMTEPNTTDDVRVLARPLGIEVGDDIVLDQEVRLLEGKSVGVRPMISDYGTHPITEQFKQNTIFSTARSVRALPTPPPEAVVTEIAFTGISSWAEKRVDLVFSETPVAAQEPEDIAGPLAIVAAFEGPVPYVEAEKEETLELVPAEASESGKAETASASAPKQGKENTEGRSRVVVFGDADFVANINIRQLFNRDFFLNSLNWVIGEEEGVSIRARSLRCSLEGLTVEQFRAMFLTGGILLPELVLILGITVWWRRRRA